MRILVLSDTHIPKAAIDLPPQVYEEIKNVDMIFHAGDFVEKYMLDKLKDLKKTWAVCGNMDSRELRDTLNTKEIIELGKLKIGLIHGYGAPGLLVETVRKEFKKVDAIIFGHSHTSTNIVKDNILFFNPGSPTDKVFAIHNSYGILEVSDKKIKGQIILLDQAE